MKLRKMGCGSDWESASCQLNVYFSFSYFLLANLRAKTKGRMKTRFIIAAVMALAAMACSRNGQNQELTGRERITFAAADESGLFSVSTKADEVTALSAFYVSAVTSSAGVEASAWTSTEFSLVPASDPATYAANKFWPSSNPSYL